MRVGLLSDSHGRVQRTAEAVRLLVDRGAELLLHLGDIETEEVLDQLAGHEVRLVFGNNDDERTLAPYASSLGLKVMHPIGELRLDDRLLRFTHGHIGACVRQVEGADYFIHGHTHQRRDDRVDGVRIINPGALHRARPFSAALLDTSLDALEFVDVTP